MTTIVPPDEATTDGRDRRREVIKLLAQILLELQLKRGTAPDGEHAQGQRGDRD